MLAKINQVYGTADLAKIIASRRLKKKRRKPLKV
jgi:hypothetical protein